MLKALIQCKCFCFKEGLGRLHAQMLQINCMSEKVFVCFVAEVHGTENPLAKRPSLDPWIWLESARKQHLNELKTRMKINQLEYAQTLKELKVRVQP